MTDNAELLSTPVATAPVATEEEAEIFLSKRRKPQLVGLNFQFGGSGSSPLAQVHIRAEHKALFSRPCPKFEREYPKRHPSGKGKRWQRLGK